MPGEPADTLAVVVGELVAVFDPLRAALDSPDALRDFLRGLGWVATGAPQVLLDLLTDVQELATIAEDGLDAADVAAVSQKIVRLAERIDALRTAPANLVPVDGAATFLAEFPAQLVRHLLGRHLLRSHPTLGALLRLAGVLVVDRVPAAPPRGGYLRIEFRPERLAAFLADPLAAIRAATGWGQDPIAVEMLLDVSRTLASGMGLLTRHAQIADDVLDQLSGGAGAGRLYQFQVRAFLLDDMDDAGLVTSVGVGFAPAPPAGAAPPGIAILPFASAGLAQSFPLDENVNLVVEAEAALDGGLAIVVRPGVVALLTGIGRPGTPGVSGAVSLGVEHRAADDAPIVLVGGADGSHLSYRAISIAGGGRLGAGAEPSVFVQVKLDGAAVVIAPAAGDADAFLAMLLPPDGFRLEFDLEVTLDSRTGLSFTGAAGLEIRYPTHVALGRIELNGLTLALRPDGAALALDAGADVAGNLGPLRVVVENIGFTARLSAGPAGGNLGVADLALGFRPPTGVGLVIDAGVVVGGGYLYADHAKGEYTGALELTISGFIAVKAIGIISTRQPDGSPGFSLLIIMTAEFFPGLQLGYGFTLIGLGGLVGLNRTVRLDALAQGLTTGAAESILFPRDLVANAPRIISDLRAIFPQRQDTFLIGPMVKLGWGTPTIVTLSLGVIIEIPGNVVILGVLTAALPTVDAPLIQLKVSFLGVVEFDKQRVWFFATLIDSRVLLIPIDGELGLLLAFGDAPEFVLTVGGFHPSFTPPPLPFPAPRRISLPILQGSVGRIIATGYFAVTANTAQFGARAEVVLAFSGFGIEGHLGFDALFRFSPFSFVVQAGASFALTAFGVGVFAVRIDATLQGPAPWHVRGRGSMSLLVFDISVDFDLTWGEERNTLAPPIAVLPLVAAELAKPESWTGQLPAGRRVLVSLRDTATDVVLHPMGTLRVSQRAVPLGSTIDRVGAQRTGDVRSISIGAVTGGLVRRADSTELFALGQFVDLSDAEKLSRKSFEPRPSGVVLAASAEFTASRAVHRVVRYEQIVVDGFGKRTAATLRPDSKALFGAFLAGNAAARGPLSALRGAEAKPFSDAVRVGAEGFVVASTATNAAVAAGARFASEAAALDFLASQVAADPGTAGSMHVIPAFEEAEL